MAKIKSCNGCRAYEEHQYYSKCLLGFHITQLELRNGEIIADGGDIRPIGDDGICPKPRTISKYIYWSNFYEGRRLRLLTPLALDGGDSAASEQLSTPEVLSTLQGESTPAHRK